MGWGSTLGSDLGQFGKRMRSRIHVAIKVRRLDDFQGYWFRVRAKAGVITHLTLTIQGPQGLLVHT